MIAPLVRYVFSKCYREAERAATLREDATFMAAVEALKAAYERSTGTMKERMEELTGGLNLNLPGLGG